MPTRWQEWANHLHRGRASAAWLVPQRQYRNPDPRVRRDFGGIPATRKRWRLACPFYRAVTVDTFRRRRRRRRERRTGFRGSRIAPEFVGRAAPELRESECWRPERSSQSTEALPRRRSFLNSATSSSSSTSASASASRSAAAFNSVSSADFMRFRGVGT
jgi:hypothetical protein